jgi:SAM-dependent methyltransferase
MPERDREMDELTRYNQERWEALAQAGVDFSRPFLDLTPETAKACVDPEGMVEDFRDKDVLCLAGGGGQQSAAFAQLGARVTVLDFCETQLARDQEAADHYGHSVTTIQGDMRDLSPLEASSFDLIWHAHSLTFIPDATPVFTEVHRVLRKGGRYRLSCWNPYAQGIDFDTWDGAAYPVQEFYVNGAKMMLGEAPWDIDHPVNGHCRLKGPHEFRHTLSTIINTQIALGLRILGIWEEPLGDQDAAPGTWDHFCAITPPFMVVWTEKEG